MCYMIKAWWIHRWYFLYISAFIILYIVALSKSLGQRHETFLQEHDIVLQITYVIQIHFYLVIRLTMHCPFIIIWFSHRFSYDFTKENILQGSWLHFVKHFSNHESWICINKTYVSHRHFYADVPIFTCVSGANAWWCLCFT